ncbi:MAG: ATP-binding cassette domain-containing protein [Aquihabitans sp.]
MEKVVIEVQALSKRFGSVQAANGVTFDAPPGQVTGFLGANGSGKSTTLRMLVGLTCPDAGTAHVGGRPYRSLPSPRTEVGAVLDAQFHPGRTARNHLRVVASASGIDRRRVETVLQEVDLSEDADRRVGGYSMGMRQRLALGVALLGDPAVLILDEPSNGLDPPGIAWLRERMRLWAGEGRTVLVSSHVLAEIAQVVDRVVIIDRGRIVQEGPLDAIGPTAITVRARTPQAAQLADAARAAGWNTTALDPDTVEIAGASSAEIGRIAAAHGFELHGLSSTSDSERLEAAFLELTERQIEVSP